MPLTTQDSTYNVSIQMRDFNNQPDSLSVDVAGVANAAAAEAAALAHAQKLRNISGLKFESIRTTITTPFDPATDNPDAEYGHQREYLGEVEVETNEIKSGKPVTRKIQFPAPLLQTDDGGTATNLLMADRRYLDRTNPQLVAYIDQWKAGGDSDFGSYFDPTAGTGGAGALVKRVSTGVIVDAYVKHTESRKQTSRKVVKIG